MTDDADSPEKRFADGRYGIKWISGSAKRKIAEAAERADLTAGEVVERAIDAYLAAERGETRFDVLAPGHKAGALTVIDSGPPLSIEELARAVELSAQLTRLRRDGMLSGRETAAFKRKLRESIGIAAPERSALARSEGASSAIEP